MAGLNDIVQKAFYLGVGIASYAGTKAGENLGKLRVQAQKLADEMVERGELTTEEAKKMVDDMVRRAQNPSDVTLDVSAQSSGESGDNVPRTIEITDESDVTPAHSPSGTDALKQQVADLEAQLRELRRQQ